MKTNLDKLFKADSTLEKEGVDFVIQEKGDGQEEISFKIRRFNAQNPRVKAAEAAYYKPYARQIQLGTLPVEKSDEIVMRLFIDVCLAGWNGVTDGDGKPMEFTKENALALFKRLPELFETLFKHANDFANYKEELGNS